MRNYRLGAQPVAGRYAVCRLWREALPLHRPLHRLEGVKRAGRRVFTGFGTLANRPPSPFSRCPH
jgi:hypothetical protein